MTALVNLEDIERIRFKAKELMGGVHFVPLAGVEIVIVIPSFAYHHSPFPHCSIVETLRELGAKVDTLALARGVGRRIAQMTPEEKSVIDEHDVAVFMFGSFESCIRQFKINLPRQVSIPVVISGWPALEYLEGFSYVGGVGRIPTMFQGSEDKSALVALADAVIKAVDEKKARLREDPPIVHPLYVKREIEVQIPSIKNHLNPAPITVKLQGLKVKLSYERHSKELSALELFDGKSLSDISDITKTYYDEILVKIHPRSWFT